MTTDPNELKALLIRELNIPDIAPEEIDDDAPLFGEGLGLDSLDAVEVVVIIQANYGVEIKNMEQGRQALQSIKSLADFIDGERHG